MEFPTTERMNFVNELSTLIDNASALADGFLSNLGWAKERILDAGMELVNCPVDKSHTIKPARLTEHMKDCQLKAAGFSNLSVKDLPISSTFFYQSPSSSVAQVILDESQLGSIGLTMKRKEIQLNKEKETNDFGKGDEHESKQFEPDEGREEIVFQLPAEYLETILSADDRLKLYEYVSQKSNSIQRKQTLTYDELEQETAEQLKVLEMQEKADTDRPKSKVEAMAELRDYKRRRQSYRAKTISQSKRPAVEVIRELIDQQMKYLEIISGKRLDEGEERENEGELNLDSSRSPANTGASVEEPARDGFEENLSQRRSREGDMRDRSNHRYGNKDVKERHRRDRSRERQYGRGDSSNRDRERNWRKDGDRDRGRYRNRDRERRSRSRERIRDRSKDDSMRDRKGDRSSESFTMVSNRRVNEYDTRTGGRDARRFEQSGRNAGGLLDDGKANEVEGQPFALKIPRSVGETDFLVEEKLKDIRAGMKADGIVSQEENITDDVGEGFHGGDIRRKRKKRDRSRSSSESMIGSRSGSKERYKERKHKHKKKKKKSKKIKEDLDGESEDEWVEKS